MNLYDVNESTENLTEHTQQFDYQFTPTLHPPFISAAADLPPFKSMSGGDEFFAPPIIQPRSHIAPLGSLPKDPVYI